MNKIRDAISRQAAQDFICVLKACNDISDEAYQELMVYFENLPPVDAIEVVRCRNCKHRPTGENRRNLKFPDDKCPCQCEDCWYDWKPADDWYCGNGERKEGGDGNG